MKMRMAAVASMVALGAWSDDPTTSGTVARERPSFQGEHTQGTGLVLKSLTGVAVPLIGSLGTVTIDQAVLTNFALVENTVGQIVGLEAEGLLKLTGTVLGTDVLTEDFKTTASVTSSGPGQCDLITIDLAPIKIDALRVASIDVPAASLTGRGSGAVGSLLCNLGNVLSSVIGGGAAGNIRELVNSINSEI